jgi:hypothetical protein
METIYKKRTIKRQANKSRGTERNKKEGELKEERDREIYRRGEVELFTFGMLTAAHKASSLYV